MIKIFNIEGTFAKWFIVLGILIQLITYYITKDSLLSLISGISGVIAVVLCSQKHISFYFWGALQIFTFVIIAIINELWFKIFENGFYFITMLFGFIIWLKNSENNKIKPKKIEFIFLIFQIIACLSLSFLSWIILKKFYNFNILFLDSVTTIFALWAQILMILGYKEQWYFWIIVDILCIILFFNINEYCMTIQYIFWTLNCVYGFIKWK